MKHQAHKDFEHGIRDAEARILQRESGLDFDNARAVVEQMRETRDGIAGKPRIKFDMSISITGLLTVLMAFGALVGGWYRFDYRVTAVEANVQLLQQERVEDRQQSVHIADTLDKINMTMGRFEQRMNDANIGAR